MAQSMRAGTSEADNASPIDTPDNHAGVLLGAEDFGVLVGWTHRDAPQGISLGMQSTRSQIAWAAREIDRRNYLLTRNQALLLARYLLEATGQQLDISERPHGWRAALAWLRGRRI